MALTFKLPILLAIILVLLPFCSTTNAQIFDITKYGAKGDGNTDISQALLSAWREACASTVSSTVMIPAGTFLLREVLLEGPCKAPIAVQLQGTVKAPGDPKQFTTGGWVKFQHIVGFNLSGGGTFDGQGNMAWPDNDCAEKKNFESLGSLPINLRFHFITDGTISGITTLNSKQFHVNVLGSKNLMFKNFIVSAPGKSPNTDGIHISRSTGITITDTNIKTGDDCISIGDGAQQIVISKVTCGPGHGISVGSLGRYKNELPVEGIIVRDSTLTNTQNGIRIKTWPNSQPNTVSNLLFENITMVNVSNPVLIDQVYCPWGACNAKIPSSVKISNVNFRGIQGTSATQVVTKMVCSQQFPCSNVEIADINLTYTGGDGDADDLPFSQCVNVQPKLFGMQKPLSCERLVDATSTSC